MQSQSILENLVEMSRVLGEPGREYAILGEGNTSARLDDETFLVKASGSRLEDIGPDDFVAMRFDCCEEMLRQPLTDLEVKAALKASCVNVAETRMPSVEAVLHSILLQLPGIQFVGHTHPIAANAILCSANAREALAGRLFPDEIVCCGVAPCLVDYIDPGLPLARGVRDAVNEYCETYNEHPKVICLLNHGIFVVGKTPRDVVAATDMFVKTCRILSGTFAMGGPRFLTPDNVKRIHTRPDEHYRQSKLGLI